MPSSVAPASPLSPKGTDKVIKGISELRVIQRMSGYPIVADTASAVHTNATKFAIVNQISAAADRVAPTAVKFAQKPYQIVAPLIDRVDQFFANYLLAAIEYVFPVVKKDKAEVWNAITSLVWWPVNTAVAVRDKVGEEVKAKREAGKGWVSLLNQKIDGFFKYASETARESSDSVADAVSSGTTAVRNAVQEVQL